MRDEYNVLISPRVLSYFSQSTGGITLFFDSCIHFPLPYKIIVTVFFFQPHTPRSVGLWNVEILVKSVARLWESAVANWYGLCSFITPSGLSPFHSWWRCAQLHLREVEEALAINSCGCSGYNYRGGYGEKNWASLTGRTDWLSIVGTLSAVGVHTQERGTGGGEEEERWDLPKSLCGCCHSSVIVAHLCCPVSSV